MPETFGERVRRRRTDLQIGLRDTAKAVGISATFLSRIETGAEKAMPREEVIRRLAEVLKDDFDTLMGLAGRISEDVKDYVKADPRMPEFLRQARERGIPMDRLMELLDKDDKKKGGR